MRIYLAAGHGKSTSGSYDPGATFDPDGAGPKPKLLEEKLNEAVCVAAGLALARCGFTVKYETTAEQASYIEAVRHANAWPADYAVEIHHNAGGGSGSLALVADGALDRTRETAAAMARHVAADLGIPYKGVISRDREYFNRETHMPSSILECAFVDGDYSTIRALGAGYGRIVGESIAQGLCARFGRRYVLPAPRTSSTASTSSTAAVPSPNPLRYGSRGPDVKYVQRWLAVRQTGWYGPVTRRAVRRYQDMRGLPVTGVVDARTWRHMHP